MSRGKLCPRILLGCFERQADALTLVVDLEHLNRDAVTDSDHGGWVVDVLPRQLRHVDKAVHAAQVNECAEVDDRRNNAFTDFARFQVGKERLALIFLGLFKECPAGQHHVVAVLVELDDLGLERLSDVWEQVTDTAELNQRGRQEATETDVHDETALDDLDHRTFDDTVVFLQLLDGAPRTLVLSTLLGENETALFVFFGEDQSFDGLAQADNL